MKRKRREEEIEDAASSTLPLEKKKNNLDTDMDNFWSTERENMLLKEIAECRHYQGLYKTYTNWCKQCWESILGVLQSKYPDDFNRINDIQFLKEKQSQLQLCGDVDLEADVPPEEGERNLLLYRAFSSRSIKLPPEPQLTSRPRRLQSERAHRTKTTNLIGGAGASCSAAPSQKLAHFLLEYKADLRPEAFAGLVQHGKLGVFQVFREYKSRVDFIDFLKAYYEFPMRKM